MYITIFFFTFKYPFQAIFRVNGNESLFLKLVHIFFRASTDKKKEYKLFYKFRSPTRKEPKIQVFIS